MSIEHWFDEHPDWRPYADLVVAPPDEGEVEAEFPKCDLDVLTNCDRGFPTVGALYVRLRREGNSDRFAAMLALQSPPRVITDSVFTQGWKRPADEFDPSYLKSIMSAAKRQGFTPPQGARYFPSLARFRGDKEAWVPQGEARGYIRRLCEKRGWGCEGSVKVNERAPDKEPQDIPLAEPIIRRFAGEMIKANPDLKRLPKRELRERVLEKHGPRK